MYERIQDYYHWKKLDHWRILTEEGKVEWQGGEGTELPDQILENAIRLLENDCFSIAIICCLMEDGKKVCMETSLWKAIFSFLRNERAIIRGKNHIYFNELDEKVKNAILNAEIFSIWLKK